MHYHLEIILPPVDDIKSAIAQILEPFSEGGTDDDGHPQKHTFLDWYVIGGRWAGAKLEAMIDEEKLKEFYDELQKRGVTVSGLQCGKQTLNPESQIPDVDALWNEFFPESPVKVCPLFSHFNNQYQHSDGYPDIMRLKDIPQSLTASHVIIAGPGWRDDGALEAKYMLQGSIWNGVNYVGTQWNGSVRAALDEYMDRLKDARPEYAAKHLPQDDWLVVTIDYHS